MKKKNSSRKTETDTYKALFHNVWMELEGYINDRGELVTEIDDREVTIACGQFEPEPL